MSSVYYSEDQKNSTNISVSEPNLTASEAASRVSLLETLAAVSRRRTGKRTFTK